MAKALKNKAKEAVIKAPAHYQAKAQRSDNPMDWLYDNPLGSYPDFTFGILKKSYQGHRNSASEFAIRKLMPASSDNLDPASFDVNLVTAFRYGVILPPGAPDYLDAVEFALKMLDVSVLSSQAALLVYATLSFPDASRLHHVWEESRAFCLNNLARKRGLMTILVQHRPGEVGSDNAIHTHLLICPRRMDGTGLRGFADELLSDDGQQLLFDEWTAFREIWR
jgi:hypothetical protein